LRSGGKSTFTQETCLDSLPSASARIPAIASDHLKILVRSGKRNNVQHEQQTPKGL
jgi:hypothetical protein